MAVPQYFENIYLLGDYIIALEEDELYTQTGEFFLRELLIQPCLKRVVR